MQKVKTMNVSFMVSNVFSDHMVLQRNRPIRVNGFGTPFTTVRVELNGVFASCKISADSTWEVELPAMNAGGPYEMVITSHFKTKICFTDIMIGDIWVCSGQSNMEYPVFNTTDSEYCLGEQGRKLCEEANDDKLRLFFVNRDLNFYECDMLAQSMAWKPATSFDAVIDTSAIGYLFGQYLREKNPDVAVGIVTSAWGGSIIQPWIDEESLITAGETELLNKLYDARKLLGDEPIKSEEEKQKDAEFFNWIEDFKAYAPESTAFAFKNWAQRDVDMSDWEQKKFRELDLSRRVGVAWYRTIIDIPENWQNSNIKVFFGAINDNDEVFFDDIKIGETTCHQQEWWCAPREYIVEGKYITAGKHAISVRVQNHCHTGGFAGDATIYSSTTCEKINLIESVWYQKQEFLVDPDKFRARPAHVPNYSVITNSVPTCLYNAMLKPLTKMDICGVLWYQGCSNAAEPANYYRYQKLLIESWRKVWRNPELPFMITQLAPIKEHRPFDRLPDDFWKSLEPDPISGFSRLREVQKLVSEEMENVGLAVTVDIGDHSDIHPKNKWDVAKRLFACAEKIAYKNDVPYLYPDCAEVKEQDGGLLLKIKNVGDSLYLKDATEIGEHMFELAGADGVYKWAQAKLVGKDEIFVSSSAVAEPKTVRYAWSAHPPFANIYSSDDLPMQPFRTDNEKLY